MNQDQVTSLVRQLLLTFGAGLVTHGYVDQGAWVEIAGGLATVLVASGWAFYTRRSHGIIASAAALPQVDVVVVKPKTAVEMQTPGVVSVPPPGLGS